MRKLAITAFVLAAAALPAGALGATDPDPFGCVPATGGPAFCADQPVTAGPHDAGAVETQPVTFISHGQTAQKKCKNKHGRKRQRCLKNK